MSRGVLPVGCLVLLVAGAPIARADSSTPGPAGSPILRAITLQAGLAFSHTMKDMLDFLSHTYDAEVALRVEKTGAATFELRGKVNIHHARISVPGTRETPLPPAKDYPLDERWTGTARWVGTTLELHFDRGFRESIAIDLTWRCVPTSVTIGSTTQLAYRCATDQRMTSRTGAGHHLPPYFQVPIVVAAPAAKLQMMARARGGADHRSEMETVEYRRQLPR